MATLPIDFIRGDIRDQTTVDEAMENIETVIHLAAITGAGRSHEIEDRVFDVNLQGAETVVKAAEAADVETFLFASSCNVYGETHAEDVDEETPPAPRNPYAESKLAAEEVCLDASVDAICLRLATNYGWSPGIRFNLVVNSFVFRALVGEPLTVYGDGSNWRPFMHVQDSARAFSHAIDWPTGIYNIGGTNHRIKEIAHAVESVINRPVKTDYLGEKDPGPSYHVDFSKAKDQGFEPDHSLNDGIADLATRLQRSPEVSQHV